MSINSMMSAIV